nr:hypothetical protein Iba_chr03aCG21980 [Ipomoea batatas]
MDPVPAALSSFVGLFFLFPSDWRFFAFRLLRNDLNEAPTTTDEAIGDEDTDDEAIGEDPRVVGPRLQRFCRRTQVAMVMAEEGSPIGGSRRWLLKRREAMAIEEGGSDGRHSAKRD